MLRFGAVFDHFSAVFDRKRGRGDRKRRRNDRKRRRFRSFRRDPRGLDLNYRFGYTHFRSLQEQLETQVTELLGDRVNDHPKR